MYAGIYEMFWVFHSNSSSIHMSSEYHSEYVYVYIHKLCMPFVSHLYVELVEV